jgi:hypothetical protein
MDSASLHRETFWDPKEDSGGKYSARADGFAAV